MGVMGEPLWSGRCKHKTTAQLVVMGEPPRLALTVEDEHTDDTATICLDPQAAMALSAELFHAAIERGAMPWLSTLA